MRVSLIIPAHNEERRIIKTLDAYYKLFKEKTSEFKRTGLTSEERNKSIKDFKIIVVANACKDKTADIVSKFKKDFKEIKLLDFKEGGKGFAVIEGFKEALKNNFELIGFIDADMATSPLAFYNLIENLKNYDGIIASRYLKGSLIKPKQPFVRRVASRVFNFLIRSLFLFNFRDSQCGAKIFKKNVVEKILPRLNMTQWAFDIDLLHNVKKCGFRIKESPTLWQDIEGSKINLKKASVQMFLAVFQLRILNSSFKRSWRFFKPLAAVLYSLVK